MRKEGLQSILVRRAQNVLYERNPMPTIVEVDYTEISNLISGCDSAIHAAERVKKGTLGGVREHVQKAIDEAVAFIGLLPPDVSNVYAESIRILNARRGVLSN
ncbi:MAG: hypothetical protein ABIP54_00030, partial [Candidatus Andersenbacteria bacterium]